MALAHPTPFIVARDDLERRQNILSTISSVISSIIDTTTISTPESTPTTTDNGGGGVTTTAVTTPTTSVDTTADVTTTSSSRTRGNTGSTAAATTSAADSGSGGSVVTEISTQRGGGTVVIERSTRAATATSTPTSAASSTSSSGAKIGGIVGGVVGGLALITAAVLLFFLWRRRKSRTGNGYFLCFGTRPNRNNRDLDDVNWPTFDPTLGSAAVGGTLGASRSGRNRNNTGHGGTLPDVEDGDDQYSPDDDMREIGSNGGQSGSYGGYYAAGAGAAAVGAAGAASAYSAGPHSTSYKGGRSEEGHYRNASQGWVPPIGSHNGTDDTAPTYDHLDPPEVREARAREQAEAHAAAMHAYNGGSPSPPPMFNQPAPAYYSTASPPPASQQRPLSDHRLSVNSQAFASHDMYADHFPQDEGTLEPQSVDQQRMLHLHNPDGH